MKPTNLKVMFGVLLISLPYAFSCRGANQQASKAGQLSQSARACALAGRLVQADSTSIFLGGKVNICQCCKFWFVIVKFFGLILINFWSS